MSQLLDLPPELIEHIFLFEESVQRIREASEHEDGANDVVTAPVFRLANRYIEQCTRRMFAKSFFTYQRILIPDHASIRRFCAKARFPDLVKYVTGLHFSVVNDRRQRLKISSATRHELVDALRAYPPTCEFVFCDAPREEPDLANYPHPACSTARNLAAPNSRKVIDMTASFSFVLSVAEEAGMRPSWINTWSCEAWRMPLFGLADCFAIAERNNVVSEVKYLNTAIVPPRAEAGVTPENA
jgi:hypothetical protein